MQTAYYDQHHATRHLAPSEDWVDLFMTPPPRALVPLIRRLRERKAYGSPGYYHDNSTWLELRVMLASMGRKDCLVHLETLEGHFGLLRKWPKLAGIPVIAGIHLSVGWWKMVHRAPEVCAPLSALIVLGSQLRDYFEPHAPGRVHLIKWGVDIAKFSPRPGGPAERPKGPVHVVFCGQFMRDMETLTRTIELCVRRDPSIQFDLVVPQLATDSPLRRVARFPQVHWHAGLDIARLVALYRAASINLMPLRDSVVNCALLEATACGLPTVANDYEGAQDYLDASFADLVDQGDASAFCERLLALAQDPARLAERSLAARAYAERELDARIGAQRHLDLYRSVLARGVGA